MISKLESNLDILNLNDTKEFIRLLTKTKQFFNERKENNI